MHVVVANGMMVAGYLQITERFVWEKTRIDCQGVLERAHCTLHIKHTSKFHPPLIGLVLRDTITVKTYPIIDCCSSF